MFNPNLFNNNMNYINPNNNMAQNMFMNFNNNNIGFNFPNNNINKNKNIEELKNKLNDLEKNMNFYDINKQNEINNMIIQIIKFIENLDIFQNIYQDIYPYIKKDKKNIIFINSNNEYKRVLVPNDIRKSELYGTANGFKIFKYSNLELYHNGKLLDNSDSTIDCILNGDCIKIVEDLKIDSSYYNSLFEKYKNKKTYEIRFEDSNTNLLLKFMSFPSGISEKEMIKAFLYNMKIPYEKRNYFVFYNYEGKILGNYNYKGKFEGDNDTQIQFPLRYYTFKFYKNFIYPEGFYGKILKVSFEDNIGLSSFLNRRDIYAGSLQKIKDFFIKIKDYISNCNAAFIYKILENPIIYPGEIELKIDDEKTFSSLGIIEDFICKLKVKIKDGSD